MRVIAGRFRGRRLAVPEGGTVRPTADRVREALFNILAHGAGGGGAGVIAGATVLDAFAGSGALGIEALSRGAAHVTFLENDRAVLRVLRRNVDGLDAADRIDIFRVDAGHPPLAPRAHDLVLMDPPYNSGLAAPALAALADQTWLTADARVVIEVAAQEPFDPPDRFTVTDNRRYGAARLVFLAHG
jgi:16S rRNA (guanine966-N2)-methyltransferase